MTFELNYILFHDIANYFRVAWPLVRGELNVNYIEHNPVYSYL
jgi:hypothetical protein